MTRRNVSFVNNPCLFTRLLSSKWVTFLVQFLSKSTIIPRCDHFSWKMDPFSNDPCCTSVRNGSKCSIISKSWSPPVRSDGADRIGPFDDTKNTENVENWCFSWFLGVHKMGHFSEWFSDPVNTAPGTTTPGYHYPGYPPWSAPSPVPTTRVPTMTTPGTTVASAVATVASAVATVVMWGSPGFFWFQHVGHTHRSFLSKPGF